jgi:folate-binding protein YgfZ
MALSHWMPIDPETNTILIRMPSSAELSYWILGPTGSLAAYRDVLQSSEELIPKLHEEDVEYLRVTAGIGQIGNEWTDSYNPLEAGLLHLTSFNKGCYIGQEVVARLDSYNKVKQRLMGLKGADVFAAGDELQVDGVVVGRVTSVVPSIHGDCWYGLGYVRGEHANVGVSLAIQRVDSVQYVVQQLLPMET